MLELLKPAIHWLHLHPFFACAATFLIAFSESIAIIGLFIPGSLLLIGIGTLIGSGVISPIETIVSAILGALLGDFLSFWVGYRYSRHLNYIWPFRVWPQFLRKGEAFFQRHGGKGIFLGRFVGPIRPITPIVAGVLKMPVFVFAIVDIISAILWAIAYMLPGILLGGAASAELSSDAVPHFILIIFLTLVAIALLYWLIEHIVLMLAQLYHRFEKSTWTYIQKKPALHLIKKIIYTPSVMDRDYQIDLFFLFIISSLLFIFISYEVVTHGFLTHYNEALHFFFRSLRTLIVDKVMIPITFLGEKRPIVALVIFTGFGLLLLRYYRAAYYWFLNAFLIFGSTGLVKHVLHIHRPLGTKGALLHGWSYPSGHTALSIAILGMLALILAQHFPRLVRKYLYVVVILLTSLIALSRLYLGIHWLTDVLGGALLGLMCISISTLFYRHKKTHIKTKSAILLGILSLTVWLIAWGVLLVKEGRQAFEQYQLSWPKGVITLNEWWNQSGETNPPLYRSNRFGKPIQTMNIQFMGNLSLLKEKLLNEDWTALNENAFKILFYKLSDQNDSTAKLPFITQQYLGQAPVLTFYKEISEDHLLILRLWNSGIEIFPEKKTLIVGAVNYHRTWHTTFIHHHNHKAVIKEHLGHPLEIVIDDLNDPPALRKIKIVNFNYYPALNEYADRDWNGEVLLIQTPIVAKR